MEPSISADDMMPERVELHVCPTVATTVPSVALSGSKHPLGRQHYSLSVRLTKSGGRILRCYGEEDFDYGTS